MNAVLHDKVSALLGIGVLAGLAFGSYYYAVLSEYEALRAPVDANSPDYIAKNLTVTEFTPDGTAKQRIRTEYGEHYADGRLLSVKPRFATVSPLEPQLKARADKGVSNDNGKSAVFTGNVVVTRQADADNPAMRFESQQATVYPDTSVITSTDPVRMTRGTDVMTGTGMRYDNVARTLELKSKVTTHYLPKPKEQEDLPEKH